MRFVGEGMTLELSLVLLGRWTQPTDSASVGCGTLSNNNITVIDYIWFIDEERLHSPEMSWYSPVCRTWWCSENINLSRHRDFCSGRAAPANDV